MSRIYCVNQNGVQHMVMAKNKHQAINYIAKRGFSASVATQQEIVKWLVEDGKSIETANPDKPTVNP